MKIWQEQNVAVSLPSKEYDGVKITVRRCGSGEFVPLKEPTLWRICKKFSIVSGSSFSALEKQIRKATGKRLMSLQDVLVNYALSTPFYIEVVCEKEKDEEVFCNQFMSFYPNKNIRLTDNVICTTSIVSICKLFYLFRSFKPSFHLRKKKFASVFATVASNLLFLDGTCIENKQVKKRDFTGKKITVSGVNSIERIEELAQWGAKHILVGTTIDLGRRDKGSLANE